MEKAFPLDQKETTQLQQLDQERTQVLAVIGALSLDMEAAKKNLEASAERQRTFIRQALEKRNVERYENAQVRNGAILATVPDGIPLAVAEAADATVERVNGPVLNP
jgi:hypothetical protein